MTNSPPSLLIRPIDHEKIIDGEYVITTLDNGTVIRELKSGRATSARRAK
jgi:hypothetical protein